MNKNERDVKKALKKMKIPFATQSAKKETADFVIYNNGKAIPLIVIGKHKA